jgi:hypothetical protein
MEALVAVGLAANIVQFVSFAREVISAGREISHNVEGALVENLEIEETARNLRGLSVKLQAPPSPKVRKASRRASSSDEEEKLRELCIGCHQVADLLVKKLDVLKD